MNTELTHSESDPAKLAENSRLHYCGSRESILERFESTPEGLSNEQVLNLRTKYGRNVLPRARPPGIVRVFLHQFTSPLIYVLVIAALVSLSIQEWSDAGFISGVLLLNAIIGTYQEYSAQRAADALSQLVTTMCLVLRSNRKYELDASELVPGDVVLLESGDRVPADLRLLTSHELTVDESLLTGESFSVNKNESVEIHEECFLADQENMVFAGTLVNRGRGKGVVVGTAQLTELGKIAVDVQSKPTAKAPLLVRMETFTHRVALLVGVGALIMAAIALNRGMPLEDVFLLAVALAVSAIPEGLPVALTVALSIGMQRMAKRNVIVRRLMAVEALGSCTCIASDKTGTLTQNRLSVQKVMLPDRHEIDLSKGSISDSERQQLNDILRSAVLANEAYQDSDAAEPTYHGDAVDIALLTMAQQCLLNPQQLKDQNPELSSIPYESENRFSASLNREKPDLVVHAKGALDKLIPMCSTMMYEGKKVEVDERALLQLSRELASRGYRIIAVISGRPHGGSLEKLSEKQMRDFTLLGLLGLIDPLRKESVGSIAQCRRAGIDVAMVTGDDPVTAAAIATELGLTKKSRAVVTGSELADAANATEFDHLTHQSQVFARVEPHQKLEIVNSLQRQGHFVAVSGDGANDAPALRTAEVGVAMGKNGTDVARETAEMIIADDNFASIVAGIEEGRIAYANVRKVIFLLISTGAAELVLFSLSLMFAMPLPLLPVQLLWLNLVTNGIQDVALAFEPGEGNELDKPPRSPKEPIFNRLMVERVVISAFTMGLLAFAIFNFLMNQGLSLESARNSTLLLMVLFENVHVFNSRSESLSAFRHNPLRNPLLLFGTLAAQLIHIGAMYTPWISDVLQIQPVTYSHWLQLLIVAFSVLIVMEGHKAIRLKAIS